MGRITDLLLARRDSLPAPVRVIGLPTDGGVMSGGVTSMTAVGLSAVWRCLDILTNGVSQLEWMEMRGNLELPPSRIVDRPHPDMTRRDWTGFVVASLALFDREYILPTGGEDSEGVPINLLPLDPTQVTPASVDTGFAQVAPALPAPEYWVGTARVPRDRLIILNRGLLPGIGESSMGIIRLARITFAAALSAEGYASRFWQAGGASNMYLTTDAAMPQTIADGLGDDWRAKRSLGPDHVPVLTGGLHAETTGADPTTQSAVEARRELVADIGRYFGVPTRILNAPTGDSETYTSTSAANLDLVRYTLQNYIGAIEDAISDLLPGKRRMVMRTRRLTRGTAYEEAQTYQLSTGGKAWQAIEEVRDDLDLGPIESPDELNPPAPAPVLAGGPDGEGQAGTGTTGRPENPGS